MNGCLADLAAALVDGELDHAAREKAQRHLLHCDACRAEVDLQRRLKVRLRGVDEPSPSDALTARLLALPATAPLDAPAGPDVPAAARPAPAAAVPPAAAVRPDAAVPPDAAAAPVVGHRRPAPAAPARAIWAPARATWAPALSAPAIPAVASATSAGGTQTSGAGEPSARRRPGPGTDAAGSRPATARPAARTDGPVGPAGRRSRPLARRSAAGSAFAVFGVAAALTLGAPPQRPASTPVDPASDAFVTEFVSTTSDGVSGPLTSVPVARAGARSTFAPLTRDALLSSGGARSTR